ncbi:MAG TPA: plasmid mobilization relaxosome protein MobC [Jiangellaceae bacterium]
MATEKVPGSAGRQVQRRRRANVVGGREHWHRVKVSAEEHERLAQLAEQHGVSVPRLLVEAALSDDASETPTQRRQAMIELFAIHRLLAAVSVNINQIAKSTNATGEFRVEATHTLQAVRNVAGPINAAIDDLSGR